MFRPQSHADANAVRQVLAGRRDVFADLVTRYERAVKGIALASCRNVQEAEDLAQEAFLRAFKDLPRLRQPDCFGPWLIQITRNLAVDRARRTAARPLPSALPDSDAFEEDPAANELHRLLREEVMRLAPAFREAILLHYFSGKSAAEIGRLLGISRAAALKRIQRGRQDLSSSLEKHLADAFQDRRGKGALVGAVMAAVATCPLPARAHTAAVAGGGATFSNATGAGLLAVLLGASAVVWMMQQQPAPAPPPIPQTRASAGAEASESTSSPPAPAAPVLAAPAAQAPLPKMTAEEDELVIAGRVINTENEPLRADVQAMAVDGFKASAGTNEKGEYRLEWLANKDYTLRVKAAGYVPETRSEVHPGTKDVNFVLMPGASVSGRLLDERTRAPVFGGEVSLRDHTIRSNAGGLFLLPTPPECYAYYAGEIVEIHARGYLEKRIEMKEVLVAKSGDYLDTIAHAQAQEIFLVPVPVISGTVVTETNEPVPEAHICAGPDLEQLATSGEDGRFEVTSPPKWPEYLLVSPFTIEGPQYRLWYPEPTLDVVADGFLPPQRKDGPRIPLERLDLAPARVDLPEASYANDIDLRVVLGRGAQVKGALDFGETVFSRPLLEVHYLEPAGLPAQMLCRELPCCDGAYSVRGLPPGQALLRLKFQHAVDLGLAVQREISVPVILAHGQATRQDFKVETAFLHCAFAFPELASQVGSWKAEVTYEAIGGWGSESGVIGSIPDDDFTIAAFPGATVNLTMNAIVPQRIDELPSRRCIEIHDFEVKGLRMPGAGTIDCTVDATDAPLAVADQSRIRHFYGEHQSGVARLLPNEHNRKGPQQTNATPASAQ